MFVIIKKKKKYHYIFSLLYISMLYELLNKFIVRFGIQIENADHNFLKN